MPFAKRIVEFGQNYSSYTDTSDSVDVLGLRSVCIALQSLVQHADSVWVELLNECMLINSRTEKIKFRVDQLTVIVNKLNAKTVKISAGSLTHASTHLEQPEARNVSSNDRYHLPIVAGSNPGSTAESLFTESERGQTNIFTETTRPACVQLLHDSAETSPLKVIRQCWAGTGIGHQITTITDDSTRSTEGSDASGVGCDDREREIGDDDFIYGPHVFSPVITIRRDCKRETGQHQTKTRHLVPPVVPSIHRPLRDPKISSSEPVVTSTSLQELRTVTGCSEERREAPERCQSQPSVLVVVNTSEKHYLQQTVFHRSFRTVHGQPIELRRGGTKHRRYSTGTSNISTSGCGDIGIIPKTNHANILRSASRERWQKAYAGESEFTPDYPHSVTPRGAKKRSKLRRMKHNNNNNEDDVVSCDWRKSLCLLVKSSKTDLSDDSLWIERRPAVCRSSAKQGTNPSERSQSLPRSFKSNVEGSNHRETEEYAAKASAIVSPCSVSVPNSESMVCKILSEKSAKENVNPRVVVKGFDARCSDSSPKLRNQRDRRFIESSISQNQIAKGSVISEAVAADGPENGSEYIQVAVADHTASSSANAVKIKEKSSDKFPEITKKSNNHADVIMVQAVIEGRTSSQSNTSEATPPVVEPIGMSGELDWSYGEVVSLNSVDQDGFYTSMHADSRLNNNADLFSQNLDALDNFSFSSFASTDLGLHGSPLFQRNVYSEVRGSSQLSDQNSGLLNHSEIKYSDPVTESSCEAKTNKVMVARSRRKVSFDGGSSPSHDGSISEAAIFQLTVKANNNAAGFMSLCAITPTNSDDEQDVFDSRNDKLGQLTLSTSHSFKPIKSVAVSNNDLPNGKVISPTLDIRPSTSIASCPATEYSTLCNNTSSIDKSLQNVTVSAWPGSISNNSNKNTTIQIERTPKFTIYEQPDQSCMIKLPPNSVNFSELQLNSEADLPDNNQTSVVATVSGVQRNGLDKPTNVMASFKSYTSDQWRQTLYPEPETPNVPNKYRPIIVVRPKQREPEQIKVDDDDIKESVKFISSKEPDICKTSVENGFSDMITNQTCNVMLPVSARLVITAPVTKQSEYIKNPFRRSVCSPVSPEELRKFSVTNQSECGEKSALDDEANALSDDDDLFLKPLTPGVQSEKIGNKLNDFSASSSLGKSHYMENLKNNNKSEKSERELRTGACDSSVSTNSKKYIESFRNYSLPRENNGNIESKALNTVATRNAHSCSNSLTKNDSRNNNVAKQARMAFFGQNSNAAISGLAAERLSKDRSDFSPRLKKVSNV